MDQDKVDQLWAKYPVIFQGWNGYRLWPECGDGWYDIIDQLCAELTKVCPTTQATQIKEKFGTLRFYVTGANQQGFDLIHDAEEKSAEVCENCGGRGRERAYGYWVSTLCDTCNAAREKLHVEVRPKPRGSKG